MKRPTISMLAFVTLLICGRPGAGAGEPYVLHGMRLESASATSRRAEVTTTGASYILTREGMELWRRIDPATNTVNPRKVATLTFDGDIGPLELSAVDSAGATITSRAVDLVFYSDGLFLVAPKRAVSYTHTSLITDAPWNKGDSLNRIWTDGYGGSLFGCWTAARPRTTKHDVDASTLSLAAGDTMFHMAFPPKPFDFENLYGRGARPLPFFISGTATVDRVADGTFLQSLIDDHFGVVMLYNTFYRGGNPEGKAQPFPVVLPSGVLGYEVEPAFEERYRNFIAAAQAKGFKIIAYFFSPGNRRRWEYPDGHGKAGQLQDAPTTLQWMRTFQAEYGLDGWYFDGGGVGEQGADYHFMRQVRTDVGEDGIIFHHNSVDNWGEAIPRAYEGWDGRKSIMVNCYVDYTMGGETGYLANEVDTPNDPYLRFHTSGYGMSQAYGVHMRSHRNRTAISEEEKMRVMAQNLNGLERSRNASWQRFFRPAFLRRKAAYLSGTFEPDVSWPIDPDHGWFRSPVDVAVAYSEDRTRAEVTWETQVPATSHVLYTKDGIWWRYQDPEPKVEHMVVDSTLTTTHAISVDNLDPQGCYEFRIRSHSLEPVPEATIWGKTLSCSTGVASGRASLAQP